MAYAEDKYGEQVAWLTVAFRSLEDPALLKKLKSQVPTIQQQFTEKKESILAAFYSANNDNSKIYHELVPRELPSLEKKSMVQALPFKRTELSSAEDPFRGLISKAAGQYSTSYQGMVAELINQLTAEVEDSDQIAKM